jgi:hypothetical protein
MTLPRDETTERFEIEHDNDAWAICAVWVMIALVPVWITASGVPLMAQHARNRTARSVQIITGYNSRESINGKIQNRRSSES